MFKKVIMILVLIVLYLFVVPNVLFAQTLSEIDWSQLGVDVVVVGFIVGLVQFFKKLLPPNLPWMAMVISMILAITYAIITNLSFGIEYVLKVAFAYACYAAWTYEALKTTSKAIKKK